MFILPQNSSYLYILEQYLRNFLFYGNILV